MSRRAELFEKYRKSDIFNLSSAELNPVQNISHLPYKSELIDSSNPTQERKKIITNMKKGFINQKKYSSKHHQSDIFNLNKTVQPEKSSIINKKRNANNYSTCFDSMKDNIQYSKDLKNYTKKNRAKKIVYNPQNYFTNENAKQRLYSQYYDNSKNPITHISKLNKSMMKSSANLLSNINIDVNNKYNTDKKNQLLKDVENAFKTHKFYKTKGFTYFENEGLDDNYNNNNKFILTENNNNSINNCKIKKQLQLQSNIFNDESLQKNKNDINEIKQRIKLAENTDETKPKKYYYAGDNNNKTPEQKDKIRNELNEDIEDKNIWGSVHNKWEKSNMDWIKDKTEITFNKTNGNNKDMNITAFQRKMNQLADSNYKDTINESIKINRKNDRLKTERYLSNLEQIDEILNDIPVLKYDKKQNILAHANTTGLNGESEVDKNILNYKKFHNNNMNKKNQKELTIKIMGKESKKHSDNKKIEEKNCINNKKYDSYNIHDYILSYDAKNGGKIGKNSFDKFSENEVKLLFSKNGVHIYDIKKNIFNNGKYNMIKFKVRDNEGEQILNEKMKEIENIFNEKDYKISIKKEGEKNYKKNLRNLAKPPFTKKLIFIDDIDNKNNKIENDKNRNKKFSKSQAFSNQYITINNNYKNHYKEEQLKNKVNK